MRLKPGLLADNILQFPANRLRDPAVARGRHRLKVIERQWPTPEEVAASEARIFVPIGGGAIRHVITGTKKHSTGMRPSRKTRRKQYHEGRAEMALIMLSEVDTRVVDYQTQPMRIEVVVDGRKHTHIVDQMRQLENGDIEMIEMKRTERDLSDPDLRLKLAVVGERYRGLRWTPRVMLERDIFSSSDHELNVRAIFDDAFAEVSDEQVRAVRRLYARRQTMMSLGELKRILDPGCRHRARAAAYALMVRREIAIEIVLPISDASLVNILPALKAPNGKMRLS